jgi:hypothetical protein
VNKKRRFQGTSSLENTVVNYPSGTAPVAWYTSHADGVGGAFDAINSCQGTNASVICAISGNPASCASYLAGKVGGHCDRTGMFDASIQYRDYPLQAKDEDVNAMLSQDLANKKSFACMYSVSSDPSKVNKKFPSSACCGNLMSNGTIPDLLGAGTGDHLEPPTLVDTDIHFCGSPIQ